MGLSLAEIRRGMDEILAFAELERFANLKLKHYSSGMSARLGYAVAFKAVREVLVLDEIFAVGDAGFKARCEERYRELRASGHTVIIVSHDPANHLASSAIARCCSTASHILMDGDATSVSDRYVSMLTPASASFARTPRRWTFTPNVDRPGRPRLAGAPASDDRLGLSGRRGLGVHPRPPGLTFWSTGSGARRPCCNQASAAMTWRRYRERTDRSPVGSAGLRELDGGAGERVGTSGRGWTTADGQLLYQRGLVTGHSAPEQPAFHLGTAAWAPGLVSC